MKLKAIIISLFCTPFFITNAQTLSKPMETAIETCQMLSNALKDRSIDPLKAANKLLKAADIVEFNDLKLTKGKELDVNGHFVFDEEFIDSLIVNRKFLEFSRNYAKKRESRGTTNVNGRIRMTTKALKAGKSVTWKTVNSGNAEFAIVAEPDGLFTMTISDKTGKVLYAETHRNKQGEPTRKVRVTLPQGKMTTLFIEITNHSKTDASFAFLKN